MDYKELQVKAKSLGIKSVGVKAKELEKIVKASMESAKVESSEKPSEKPSENVNVAVVYHGKNEVRRYTKKIHGKEFVKLAEEFASDRKYHIVSLIEAKPQISCPSCGHEFDG